MTSTFIPGQNIHCGFVGGGYTKLRTVEVEVGFHRIPGPTVCDLCGSATNDPDFPMFHHTATKYEVNQHKRELERRDKRLAYYARRDAHRDALARRQRQLDADARREVASVALRAVHAASVKGGK